MYKVGIDRAMMSANKMFEELIYDISLTEGNQMSLLETASTLSGKSPKNAKTKDIILVTNLKNGFDYILEKIKEKDFYFDKDTLCRVNRFVASNDNFDNLGGFRHYNIKISGAKHTGVDVSDLEISFFETINKYYTDNREGVRTVDLFLDLCKNQYFGDGNKRTAQLIMCGLLISEGYVPFSINFKETEYSKMLVDFYDDENKRELILKKLLEKQDEITKSFLSKEEIKEFEETKIKEFVNKIGIEETNKMILNKVNELQKSNFEVTKEFIFSIKDILGMQKILDKDNLAEIKTKDLYSTIHNFFENNNKKGINAVFNYLKKLDFPIEYIEDFNSKFNKEIKILEKENKKIANDKELEI